MKSKRDIERANTIRNESREGRNFFSADSGIFRTNNSPDPTPHKEPPPLGDY